MPKAAASAIPAQGEGAVRQMEGKGSWDELRREARRLEGEAEARLATYARGGGGEGAEGELERVLGRLEAVGQAMERALPQGDPPKQHTLARHKGVLQDLRRETARARAGRERSELLGPSVGVPTSTPPGPGEEGDEEGQQGPEGERARLVGASSKLDQVLNTASSALSALSTQRSSLERASGSRPLLESSVISLVTRSAPSVWRRGRLRHFGSDAWPERSSGSHSAQEVEGHHSAEHSHRRLPPLPLRLPPRQAPPLKPFLTLLSLS